MAPNKSQVVKRKKTTPGTITEKQTLFSTRSHFPVSFILSEIISTNTSNPWISPPNPKGEADRGLKHITKINKLRCMRRDAAIVCVHLFSLSESKAEHVNIINILGLSSCLVTVIQIKPLAPICFIYLY